MGPTHSSPSSFSAALCLASASAAVRGDHRSEKTSRAGQLQIRAEQIRSGMPTPRFPLLLGFPLPTDLSPCPGRGRAMQAADSVSAPVPVAWHPALALAIVALGLLLTASFSIYEATSSRQSRSLAKEITTAAVASVFLGFGSLFVLLASGVYV
ncbi:hypothetical protein ACP4OV_009250 [Aristida adscensionis]